MEREAIFLATDAHITARNPLKDSPQAKGGPAVQPLGTAGGTGDGKRAYDEAWEVLRQGKLAKAAELFYEVEDKLPSLLRVTKA